MAKRKDSPPPAARKAAALDPLATISLLLAAALAYANSFRGVFVLDDLYSILDNASIRSLRHPLAVLFAPTNATRPVVALSLAVNYAISGLEPWSYHAFNVLVHGLAAVTLYRLLRRMLPQMVPAWQTEAGDHRAGLLAWATALLWAVHPLQTQAVDYVIQRAEAMMGLFFLATIYSVVRALQPDQDRRAAVRWQITAVIACALSMGCKQVAAAAPVLALLYDRTFASGTFRAALRRRPLIYAGMAASYALVPLGLALALKNDTAGAGVHGIGRWDYLASQFHVISHYLWLSVWPATLCFDYGWPVARRASEILPYGLLIGGLGAATLWCLTLARAASARAWGFLGAWFFLILAPTSSFMPIVDLAAERRLYLPLAAVILAAVLGLHGICTRAGKRAAFPAVVILLALVLGGLTLRRNADYRSVAGLWADTARKRPDNVRAFNSWGQGLEDEGRTEEALPKFRRALALQPDLAKAHHDVAHALDVLQRQRGDLGNVAASREIEHEYREALRYDPGFDTALYNLALFHHDRGDLPTARALYEKLLQLHPAYVAGHYNLGNLLYSQQQYAAAAAQFSEVLRYRPEAVDAWCNRGVAELALGQFVAARDDLTHALSLDPQNAFAHANLATVLRELGR